MGRWQEVVRFYKACMLLAYTGDELCMVQHVVKHWVWEAASRWQNLTN